jgi:hypothetical protein
MNTLKPPDFEMLDTRLKETLFLSISSVEKLLSFCSSWSF